MLHATVRARTLVLAMLLLLISPAVVADVGTVAAGQRVSLPALTDAAATSRAPGTVAVTGRGFTPGGPVYVALYDQWGTKLYPTRWVMASLPLSIPDARKLVQAGLPVPYPGTLRTTFGRLCGATAMVRAYDERTAVWSNWLDVQPEC